MANKQNKAVEKKVVIEEEVKVAPVKVIKSDYKGALETVLEMIKAGVHVEKIMKFIQSVL